MAGETAVVRYVTVEKFAEISGYTKDAIRMKIKRKVFPEGDVYYKAPDGRDLIDIEGYEKWVISEYCTPAPGELSRAELRRAVMLGRARSASASDGKANGSPKPYPFPPRRED